VWVKLEQKKGKWVHLLLLLLLLAIFIWSLIKPVEGYKIWAMEVLPAVVFIVIMIFTYKKFTLTTLSYVIITLLSILTFIGGHYSYSKVPLFNWLKDHFDLQRNHYDRFGHFLKGFIVIVIRELLVRKTPLIKSKITSFIALCITLSFGALYEIVEWLSTKITGRNTATNDFLGMQGDEWDAQWDMFLVLLGSILALAILTKLHDKLLDRKNR
jgi:putative membrane protein